MTRAINGPVRIGDHPELLAAVRRLFNAGRAEGAFAIFGREVPDGGEAVVWIGEREDPIGFATYVEITANRLWVDLLYVRPDHRRQGLASALVDAVAEAAARLGRAEVLFGSLAGNAAMQSFCQARSIVPISVVFSRAVAAISAGNSNVRQ